MVDGGGGGLDTHLMVWWMGRGRGLDTHLMVWWRGGGGITCAYTPARTHKPVTVKCVQILNVHISTCV